MSFQVCERAGSGKVTQVIVKWFDLRGKRGPTRHGLQAIYPENQSDSSDASLGHRSGGAYRTGHVKPTGGLVFRLQAKEQG